VSGVLFFVSLPGRKDGEKKILTFYRIVNDKNMFFDIFCVSRVLFIVSLPGSFFMKDGEKKILTFYRIVYDF
jgi:hypothetical protein